MIDYGKTQSTEKPEAMVIDEHSVWISSDIVETSEGFEFNLKQYTKDEYILKQNAETNSILKNLLGVSE